MGGIDGVLPVEEVDLDAVYAVTLPHIEFCAQNVRVAVAEIGQRVAPYDDLDPFPVRVIDEVDEIIDFQVDVPSAVENGVFPAHFRRQVYVFALQVEVVLRFFIAVAVCVDEPVPGDDARFDPVVIIDRFLLFGKAVVIVGFPVFRVVVHFFDEFALRDGVERARNADPPGRFEGIRDHVVGVSDARGRVNGLENARARIFIRFFEVRTVKAAADEVGLGDERIHVLAAQFVEHRHGNGDARVVGGLPAGEIAFVREEFAFGRDDRRVFLNPHRRTLRHGEFGVFAHDGDSAFPAVDRADAVTERVTVVIRTHVYVEVKVPRFQRQGKFVAVVRHLGMLARDVFVRARNAAGLRAFDRKEIEVVLFDRETERRAVEHGQAVFFDGVIEFPVAVDAHFRLNAPVGRGDRPGLPVLGSGVPVPPVAARRAQRETGGKEKGGRYLYLFHPFYPLNTGRP